MTPDAYQALVKQMSPPSPIVKNTALAFLVGGAICTVGQLLSHGSHLGKRCLSVSEHPVIGEQLGVLRDVGFRDSVRDCLESLVSDFSPALPSATSAGRGHASREVCSPDITLPSAVATATVHTEAVPRIRTRLAQAYVPKHRPMAKSVAGLQYLVRIYTIIHCSALFNQSQRST